MNQMDVILYTIDLMDDTTLITEFFSDDCV
ncbi:MAG: hypothetical protein ACJATN_002317 [Neolewinella sp.]|jgi:hypothetical protein